MASSFSKKIKKLEAQYAAGKISKKEFAKQEDAALDELDRSCGHRTSKVETTALGDVQKVCTDKCQNVIG